MSCNFPKVKTRYGYEHWFYIFEDANEAHSWTRYYSHRYKDYDVSIWVTPIDRTMTKTNTHLYLWEMTRLKFPKKDTNKTQE